MTCQIKGGPAAANCGSPKLVALQSYSHQRLLLSARRGNPAFWCERPSAPKNAGVIPHVDRGCADVA